MYRKGNLRYASCRRLELVNKIHNLQTSIQCRELTLRRRCAPRLLFSSSSGPVISLQTMSQVRGFVLFAVHATFTNFCLTLGYVFHLGNGRGLLAPRFGLGLRLGRGLGLGLHPGGFGIGGASSSWPWCFLLDRCRLIDAADLGRFLGVLEPLPSRATMPS